MFSYAKTNINLECDTIARDINGKTATVYLTLPSDLVIQILKGYGLSDYFLKNAYIPVYQLISFNFNEWGDVKIMQITGTYRNYLLHSSGILQNKEEYYYMFSLSGNYQFCTSYDMVYYLTDVHQTNTVWDIRESAFN